MRSLFRKIREANRPFCTALVAAAGSSSRMGGTDKLMEFLDNVPVLMRTLTALQRAAAIDEIVIAAREDALVDISTLCKTIKTVAEDGTVTGTPDRSTLRAVQTPQVFETDLLKAALQSALENEVPVTDDCSAVERLGKVVYLIDGDEENLKITTPVDLVIAEAILAEREGR